jgi:GNAT superfamily N-acetyltransferase
MNGYWQTLSQLLNADSDKNDGFVQKLTPQEIAEFAQKHTVWTIDVDNLPVACIFAKPQNGYFLLQNLVVANAHKGKWLAAGLLKTAECQARDLGISTLRLETHRDLEANNRLLSRLGFEQVSTLLPNGFVMEKPVGPALPL